MIFGLMDKWRVKNPHSSQFTWHSLNPLIQRRLDYFLTSSEIQPIISAVLIKPAVATDHSANYFTIKLHSEIITWSITMATKCFLVGRHGICQSHK